MVRNLKKKKKVMNNDVCLMISYDVVDDFGFIGRLSAIRTQLFKCTIIMRLTSVRRGHPNIT